MFWTVFTRRTLKGKLALQKHLKGTWALGNLRHSGTRRLKGHLGTQALKAGEHLDTQALKGHLGTEAMRHLGTWVLGALEALYLANSSLS